MRQRPVYLLLGIIVLFVLCALIDASDTFGKFEPFGRPIPIHQGLDLQGGLRILFQSRYANPAADSMTAARDILSSRINGISGVTEPVLNLVGNNRISVELPGVKNPNQVTDLLKGTGNLTIQDSGSTSLATGAVIDAKTYPVLFKGSDIKQGSGQVGFDPTTGAPLVTFSLQGSAVDRFATYTVNNIGRFMAIAMDGIVVTDARIQQAIPGGSVQITGIGTVDAATAIAIQLKYGALPIPLDVVGLQQVNATLGPAYVTASERAGIIGLIIVVLFMLIYYRLPGLLADLALMVYASVVFALFKLIPVTLTLEGIAGFVLSIGMAVDANVLIFERFKEELRAGKTLGAAIDAGFARAWTSIRDSNISTMLTCIILFWFGNTFAASIIVGFALTLFIGVVVSMFTAILVTRTFLRLLVRRSSARPTVSAGGIANPTGNFRRGWFGAGL